MATIVVGDATVHQENDGRTIQERFYAMICGLRVRERSTFMEFGAQSDSDAEDFSGEALRQRQRSAPATLRQRQRSAPAAASDKIADSREKLARVDALESTATGGLAVEERSRLRERAAPRGRDVEDVNGDVLQRQCSASEPTSGEDVYTSESLASVRTGAVVYMSESLASVLTMESLTAACAVDEGAASLGAEEGAEDSALPHRRARRSKNNLCKTKRTRLRTWQDRAAAAIAEDPFVDIDSFKLPFFVEISEELTYKVRAKMLEVQQQVLAGVGGPPSHPGAALAVPAAQ